MTTSPTESAVHEHAEHRTVSVRHDRVNLSPAIAAVFATSAALLGLFRIGAGLSSSEPLWMALLFTALFWVWAAAGATLWWRRPARATGLILMLGGVAVLLASLSTVGEQLPTVVGAVFANSLLAVAVHALLTLPSGHAEGVLSRSTIVLAYLTGVGLQLVRVLLPADDIDLFFGVTIIQRWVGVAVVALSVVVVAKGLAAMRRVQRRRLTPFIVAIVALIVLLPLSLDPPTLLGDEVLRGS